MLAYGLISVVTTFLKQSYLCEELLLENSLILLQHFIIWFFVQTFGYTTDLDLGLPGPGLPLSTLSLALALAW